MCDVCGALCAYDAEWWDPDPVTLQEGKPPREITTRHLPGDDR